MAELVAKSNGSSYSVLLREEKTWRVTEDKPKEEYTPFKGYTPHHLKNLKRGCKLFLENHWPAFADSQKEFTSSQRK